MVDDIITDHNTKDMGSLSVYYRYPSEFQDYDEQKL